MSLWGVDDEATATIMQEFYHHLQEGRDKSDALHRAKLDYLRTAKGEKKDPFYWAPFILLGDWSPVALTPSRPRVPIAALVIAVLASLILLALARRKRVPDGTRPA